MKLSVIMPAYNEERTIEKILRKVDATGIEKEIIVVDDASTDSTGEIISRLEGEIPGLKIVRHERNRGKGAAIRSALPHVEGDIVIIQDADLEYDPGEYSKIIAPIKSGDADVVYGSRFLGGPHRVLYYWHYVANKLITTIANALYNVNLNDLETCYKAFRTEVIKTLEIRSNRFGFEPEVTAKVIKAKYRIYEVPISYYGRTYEEGKKITWKDGIAAIFFLVRYRFFN
ncbi:MAG: glycosyltransferase family 2 protein [Candidatus Tritonobacter lacicola]|nr:glycosyltransferase family 2 protein [Candidatus Tritonobacter lacicola]